MRRSARRERPAGCAVGPGPLFRWGCWLLLVLSTAVPVWAQLRVAARSQGATLQVTGDIATRRARGVCPPPRYNEPPQSAPYFVDNLEYRLEAGTRVLTGWQRPATLVLTEVPPTCDPGCNRTVCVPRYTYSFSVPIGSLGAGAYRIRVRARMRTRVGNAIAWSQSWDHFTVTGGSSTTTPGGGRGGTGCPPGQTRPHRVCRGNRCVQVNACGVSTCLRNADCVACVSNATIEVLLPAYAKSGPLAGIAFSSFARLFRYSDFREVQADAPGTRPWLDPPLVADYQGEPAYRITFSVAPNATYVLQPDCGRNWNLILNTRAARSPGVILPQGAGRFDNDPQKPVTQRGFILTPGCGQTVTVDLRWVYEPRQAPSWCLDLNPASQGVTDTGEDDNWLVATPFCWEQKNECDGPSRRCLIRPAAFASDGMAPPASDRCKLDAVTGGRPP